MTDELCICEAPLGDGSDTKIKVYATERAFLAPKMATKADERGVRISKTILDKEIPQEQAIKLFVEGKTDLMPGFRSKKGRRFAAHLTLDYVTGKLGFEFAPRKKKKSDADDKDGDAEDGGKKEVKATKKKAVKKKTVKKKPAKKKKTTKKKGVTKKKS